MMHGFGAVRVWFRSAVQLSAHPSWLLTLVAAVLGPAVLVAWHPRRAIFVIVGAAGWAVSVAFKRLGWKPIGAIPLPRARGMYEKAALNGFWSAVCELGLAMLLMRAVSRPDGLMDALAFGTGAAALEILYLCGLSLRHVGKAPSALPDHVRDAVAGSLLLRNMFFVERLLASGTHVAARALLFESLRLASAWPAIVAVMAFASIDGAPSLGRSMGWNWFDPAVAGRYYGFVASVVVAESIVIALIQASFAPA